MPLEMTTEKLGPACAVLALDGSLTLGTSLKTLDGNVQQLIEDGVNKLVIDLSRCAFCDSAGLGFLVHTYGLAAQSGGGLRLCGVGSRIMDLLTMTTTDRLLPCDPDRETSLAKLGCADEGKAS